MPAHFLPPTPSRRSKISFRKDFAHKSKQTKIFSELYKVQEYLNQRKYMNVSAKKVLMRKIVHFGGTYILPHFWTLPIMLSLCFFHKKNRIEIHARLRFSEPIRNFKPLQYPCEPLQTATLALLLISFS